METLTVDCPECGEVYLIARQIYQEEATGVICPYCQEYDHFEGDGEPSSWLPSRAEWALQDYFEEVKGSPLCVRKPSLRQMRSALLWGDQQDWGCSIGSDYEWEFEGRVDRMEFALFNSYPTLLKKNKSEPKLLGSLLAESYENEISNYNPDSCVPHPKVYKKLQDLGLEEVIPNSTDDEEALDIISGYKERARFALREYVTDLSVIEDRLTAQPTQKEMIQALAYGDKQGWKSDWEEEWMQEPAYDSPQLQYNMEKALYHVNPALRAHRVVKSSHQDQARAYMAKNTGGSSSSSGCLDTVFFLLGVLFSLQYLLRVFTV